MIKLTIACLALSMIIWTIFDPRNKEVKTIVDRFILVLTFSIIVLRRDNVNVPENVLRWVERHCIDGL